MANDNNAAEGTLVECTYEVDDGASRFYYISGVSPTNVKYGADSSWTTSHNLYSYLDTATPNLLLFGTSSRTMHGKGIYSEFTASVVVAAGQKLTVNYNMNFSCVRGNYIASGMAFEIFNYGYSNDTVTAPTAKSVSDEAMSEEPARDFFLGYGESKLGTSNSVGDKYPYSVYYSYSDSNSGGVVDTTDIRAEYENMTTAPQTFTQRFGFWACLGYGSSNYATIDGRCTITPTVVSDQTLYYSAPEAVTEEYDGTDMLNPLSAAITSADWYVDGGIVFRCENTVKDSGTYTVTASLSDAALNGGVQWLLGDGTTTTDDQTFTFTVTPIVITSPKNAVITAEYNGLEQSLKTLTDKPAWYNQSVYSDPSIIQINDKFTDAGSSAVNVKIVSGNYAWSDGESNLSDTRSFTIKITAKPLSVKFEEQNGLTVACFGDTSEIYSRDNGEKYPKLITKYYQSGDSPNSAVGSPTGVGQWIAIALLENADSCNYSVNAISDEFTVSKIIKPYPVLSASGSYSVPYNGSNQTFVFEGFDAQLMDYKAPAGAVSFDGVTLTAKDAGEYKIEFTLKDGNFYEWSGNTELSVTIDRKNIVITADEDNLSDWSKGEDVELKFRVTGLVSGDSVKLDASYTKGGSGASKIAVTDNGDGTHSVIIPKSYGTGEYVLTVKAADGENYVERAAATHSFKISAEGLDLGENEIKWKLGGKTYTVADLKDGFLEIEYSGKALTLSVDISLSESAAELEIESYGGDYATAINVGSYTATVHIVAVDPNLYTFDQTYTLNIKIVPKSLDFADAEWEWQYAGEGEWKPLTDRNMPPFDNRAVEVRISGEYFAGLGLGEGDYTVAYTHNSNLTEKGDKTTTAQITVSNRNFAVTAGTITKDWKITAKSLGYAWTGSQNITAGANAFAFPAIEFNDGNDYTGFFEYIFTVDGEEGEFTKEELEAYIAEHWSETTVITGKVHVRPIDGQEVEIEPDSHIFTTGTPKTPLNVTINSEGSEYGNVNFVFEVKRGGADESARTVVTIADKTFAGDSAELYEYISGLPAGEYRIKVSVTEDSEDMYVVTGDYDYLLTIAKRKVALPALKEGVTFKGETIYFKDCITGFDEAIMSLDGIDNGTEWRENGYYTTVRLTDPDNYEFEGENKSEFEYNWHIGKFVITEDMWDMSGKKGAALSLPDWVKGLLADPAQLKLDYRYYMDAHSEAMETVEFVKGTTYYVDATLTGRFADSFEFENGISFEGVQTSAKALYTVPLGSGAEQFFEDAWEFVKKNYWVVIVGIIDLILIIFVIVKLAKGRSDDEEEEEEEDDEEDDDDDDDDEDDEEE